MIGTKGVVSYLCKSFYTKKRNSNFEKLVSKSSTTGLLKGCLIINADDFEESEREKEIKKIGDDLKKTKGYLESYLKLGSGGNAETSVPEEPGIKSKTKSLFQNKFSNIGRKMSLFKIDRLKVIVTAWLICLIDRKLESLAPYLQ